MQDAPIFQSALPFLPWMDPRTARLPGILPVEGEDWLRVDDAFAGQMALRDRLIAVREAAVHSLLEEAHRRRTSCLIGCWSGCGTWRVSGGTMAVLRPDGVEAPLDRGAPLLTLGRLVQEDLCLLQSRPGRGAPPDRGRLVLSRPAGRWRRSWAVR